MSRMAVVTGASSGIGRATALALVEEGWRVVVIARRRERLEELAREARPAPGGAILVEPLDASDGAAVLAMARRVRDAEGAPSVIVNSAGAGAWRYIEDTPPDAAERMMGAPFKAAYNITHAFMRGMLDRERGVIIHVGSPASIMPWAGATAYVCSRWALRGLHEALTLDLHGTGVHSCHVLFGKVSSEYFQANADSEQHIPTLARIIPESTPETCAQVLLDVIRHPRRDVFHPPMLRALDLIHHAAPGLFRQLVIRTGRQR